MYARSTTVQGTPQNMDAGIAYVRDEVMPALATMPGCIGLSMLADRATGRCIVTSSWDSEESMKASADGVREIRARAAEILGGEATVAEWEIAMMHRKHEAPDGAVTRVVWGESDPARADDNMNTVRTMSLPRMEALPGFCSMSLFVDRETGRSAMVTTYDSREDMERATDQAMMIRQEATESMGVRVTDVAEFDLVLHQLRVPETV
jgi:heme-degrading monooxygenase HmoA